MAAPEVNELAREMSGRGLVIGSFLHVNNDRTGGLRIVRCLPGDLFVHGIRRESPGRATAPWCAKTWSKNRRSLSGESAPANRSAMIIPQQEHEIRNRLNPKPSGDSLVFLGRRASASEEPSPPARVGVRRPTNRFSD